MKSGLERRCSWQAILYGFSTIELHKIDRIRNARPVSGRSDEDPSGRGFCAFSRLLAGGGQFCGPTRRRPWSASGGHAHARPDAHADSGQAAKPPIEYVESRGIVLRTPDGLFEASLGFNLQVRFSDFDLDVAAGGIDADEFRVRRFKLFLSGFAFDPRLTWRFQADFASTAANRILDDAWLNWRFSELAPGAVWPVQDALLARGALQRRVHPVPGAVHRGRRLQAEPRHRPDGGGLLVPEPLRLPGRRLRRRRPEHDCGATNHVMPVMRLVVNPFGTMGGTEADLQNHKTPALSIGANGFVNTLRKVSDTSFEALTLNYAGPAGWLGRNIQPLHDRRRRRRQVVGIRRPVQVARPFRRRPRVSTARPRDRRAVSASTPMAGTARRASSSFPSTSTLRPATPIVDYNRNVDASRLATVFGGHDVLLPPQLPEDHPRLHADQPPARRPAGGQRPGVRPAGAVDAVGVAPSGPIGACWSKPPAIGRREIRPVLAFAPMKKLLLAVAALSVASLVLAQAPPSRRLGARTRPSRSSSTTTSPPGSPTARPRAPRRGSTSTTRRCPTFRAPRSSGASRR